tara:strand:+ start:507 stop:857 length:351 start_codon:yes stop_codon:yes gene_type:complete
LVYKNNFKNRIKKWFTIDHVIDLIVDVVLLVWDVITSPILIVMRLFRNFFGDWLKEKIKAGLRLFAHFYVEKCNRWQKVALTVFLFIVVPFMLIILFGTLEISTWILDELELFFKE